MRKLVLANNGPNISTQATVTATAIGIIARAATATTATGAAIWRNGFSGELAAINNHVAALQ